MIQDEIDLAGGGIYLWGDERDAEDRGPAAVGSRPSDDAPDCREACNGTKNGLPHPRRQDDFEIPQTPDDRPLRAVDRRTGQGHARSLGHPGSPRAAQLRLYGRLRDGQAGDDGVSEKTTSGVLRVELPSRRPRPTGWNGNSGPGRSTGSSMFWPGRATPLFVFIPARVWGFSWTAMSGPSIRSAAWLIAIGMTTSGASFCSALPPSDTTRFFRTLPGIMDFRSTSATSEKPMRRAGSSGASATPNSLINCYAKVPLLDRHDQPHPLPVGKDFRFCHGLGHPGPTQPEWSVYYLRGEVVSE